MNIPTGIFVRVAYFDKRQNLNMRITGKQTACFKCHLCNVEG